ncbi:MAG: hypothetical protein J0L59_01460 [Xanthomonadales bacterium]|nr:hypothetical protein [Xanthomonadales bacterium]
MDRLILPLPDDQHAVEILTMDDKRILLRLVDLRASKRIRTALAFGGCKNGDLWAYDDSLVAGGFHVELPPSRVGEACAWMAERGLEFIDERSATETAVH